MGYRTLTELESDIRYQFDLDGFEQRHTQAQIFRLVNESIREMRKLVTERGSSQYLATVAATAGPSASSGYSGSLVTFYGGADPRVEMVRRVMAQGPSGGWYQLDQIPLQYLAADGTRDDITGKPTGWVLLGWNVEKIQSSPSSQYRQVLIVPPLNSTYNLRVIYLPGWTDAISTDRVMDDNGNLEWVKWRVGCKVAERDNLPELASRQQTLMRLEQQMLDRATREGSPVRSRIAVKRMVARRW
jgi:hypothetical protein